MTEVRTSLYAISASSWSTTRRLHVSVLEADRELAAVLDERRRSAAELESRTALLVRSHGVWDARSDADAARDGYGLLVLEGLLVRRVGLKGRFSAELLGPGDVLQPAEHDGELATVPFEARWRVLRPLRLAVLDLAWATRMAAFPQIAVALHERMLLRSRRMATLLAITHQPRLDDRLLLFFRDVADRFGRVRADGVVLAVPMTHELIGHLVGAERPSVSAALNRLERAGLLKRGRGEWTLPHASAPPDDLHGEPTAAAG